ncbi:MAG: hypothetical protein AAFX08_11555 [Pseudomonadota bacterium]
MADEDLEALEADLPGLTKVGAFVRELDAIPWFANLGEPLSPGAEAAAKVFSDALGFPHADVAVVANWEDAAAAAESLDWNTPAWEAEELLRTDIAARALDELSEDALKFSMAAAADAVSSAADAAIEEASSIWDLVDPEVRQLAVGAAAQAAHGALLSRIAGAAEDDPAAQAFNAKFQLFEFGRWPIGVAGQTFNLF